MMTQQIGNLASKVVNRWAWWQAALQNPDGIGRGELTVSEAQPEQGYYRVRRKGGDWEPVAIFYPEGSNQLVAYRDGREVSDVNGLWVWACRNPVTFDAYERAMSGEGWADEPERAPTMGDNSGEADPFDAIKIELLGEVEQAREFIKEQITSKESADKAGIWATRIRNLRKRAKAEHQIEKRPHLEAGRAVDDKWRELTDLAESVVDDLKKALEPYLREQRRIEQERARKAAEEAERQRRAAQQATDEEARIKALQAAQEAERNAQAKSAQAGRTGAKVSIRIQKVGRVTDYQKAAATLVEMKHPDMIKMIDTLASRAAKAGMPFAGMEIKQEETVA